MKLLIAGELLLMLVASSGCTSGGQAMADCGGDLDCFDAYVANCTPAKLTHSLVQETESSSIFSMKGYAEVRGPQADRCVIYAKVTEISFPEDMQQYLSQLGEGFPEFGQLEGSEMTCRLPISGLSQPEEPGSYMNPLGEYCEGTMVDIFKSIMQKMQDLMESYGADMEDFGEES